MKKIFIFPLVLMLFLSLSLTAMASGVYPDEPFDAKSNTDSRLVSISRSLSALGNDGSSFSPAKPLPKLTGNQAYDFVNTAYSQIGYTESSTKETVYSDWAGQKGAAWCSEFVSWCAHYAGISREVLPPETAAVYFRNYFMSKGQYFAVKNNVVHKRCACAEGTVEKISPKDIRRGDIILIDSNKGTSYPVHTCIALSVEGDNIVTIDGNINGRVKKVKRSIDRIHGVCRPAFNQCKKHTYDKGVVSQEATCSKKGTKTYTCIYCGHTKQADISTTAHHYSEYEIVRPATTTTEGIKEKTCETCSKIVKSSIPKVGKTIKLNHTSTVRLGLNKSISVKITEMPKGDAVKSIKASNSKIISVKRNGTVTALKKGSSTVTVTTKSGKKAAFKVVVP